MFTIEEYIELKKKIVDLELELFKVSAAFKYTLKVLNDNQKNTAKKYIDICNLSEETKTHIYDSRIT